MSDAPEKASKKGSVRRQRSIYQVHYSIKKREEMTAKPLVMPNSSLAVQKYGRQVAGHRNTEDTKFLGLLQCNNGTILKPIIKQAQRREVQFYCRVSRAASAELAELRRCVPAYYGCTAYTYAGHTQDYIVLEDLAAGMLEPCIMDVKIGKRTWDPLATEEKIKNEEKKYARCKQQYGFCIPGFQVYRLTTGQLCKYNKDYGKRLHSNAVIDALRNYLNGTCGGLCRALVLQLLAALWRAQAWARRQRCVRLWGASLLLLYDAARLRDCCRDKGRSPLGPPPPARRRSAPSAPEGASFSGQLSSKGPVYSKLSSVPLTSLHVDTFSPPPAASPWTEALDRLDHNHSFDHNYEDKLSKIKMDYRATLERLCSDSRAPDQWATVKIIDFAHAFFNDDEEGTVDDNFREGIDNFVEIMECFLKETDDQIS